METKKENHHVQAEAYTDLIHKDALSVIIEKAPVLDETKVILHSAFDQFYSQVNEIKALSNDLIVTNESQVDLMKQAGELRKKLVKVRTQGIDPEHKKLKEDSLAYTKVLDEIKRTVTLEIQSIEAFLSTQEKFAENAEAERKKKRKEERESALRLFEVDTMFIDLENMPDEKYLVLLQDSKRSFEAKLAEAKRLEEERIEKERKDLIRQQRNDAIRPYLNFVDEENAAIDLAEISEDEFLSIYTAAVTSREDFNRKAEETLAENERLKKEKDDLAAEQTRKSNLQEKRLSELLPYNAYGEAVDMPTLWALTEDKYQETLASKKAAWKKNQDEIAEAKKVADQKLADEQAAKKKLEDELKEKQRIEDAAKLKAEQDEEAKLSMGDKAKFGELIEDLEKLRTKHFFKSAKYRRLHAEVVVLLDKIINHAISKQ